MKRTFKYWVEFLTPWHDWARCSNDYDRGEYAKQKATELSNMTPGLKLRIVERIETESVWETL
jgi:hypothetical protein